VREVRDEGGRSGLLAPPSRTKTHETGSRLSLRVVDGGGGKLARASSWTSERRKRSASRTRRLERRIFLFPSCILLGTVILAVLQTDCENDPLPGPGLAKNGGAQIPLPGPTLAGLACGRRSHVIVRPRRPFRGKKLLSSILFRGYLCHLPGA
jgi:hypothetical protein